MPPLPEASHPRSHSPMIWFYLPVALTSEIILFISVLTHVLPVPVLERVSSQKTREYVTFTAVFTAPSSVPSTQ